MQDIEQFQMELMKKEVLRKVLSKQALERLSRVKIANPTLAEQIEAYLIQVNQAGQLKETVSDAQLKKILDIITTKKKTKITRK